MLQQTRVATVAPYYQKFLERFPDVEALARAPEAELLRAWSGLGYYARARNLRKAARRIVERGGFPRTYEEIRGLPGVGEYTAAAVASMAFGLSHAVLDGNVMRVLARLGCEEGKPRLREAAAGLLDRKDPGGFNQALMELGATVCLPRGPRCGECPLARWCQARRQGREAEFPVRRPRPAPLRVRKTLLVAERRGRLLLKQRNGFWELPTAEELPEAQAVRTVGEFRHSITNHHYVFTVAEARVAGASKGLRWVAAARLGQLPLSTVARKALNTRICRP